ncbi:MAG: hypothetical protein N4A35_08225 [Flavobacteriales bacterium]|nr:hypothetical protein [Flavobacteriales bacterium]
MKAILTFTLSLFIGQTISFAQAEMEVMEQEHKAEVFLEQNLMDFNAKYHSAFIAAYQKFESILGEKEQQKDYIQYQTKIDFNAGKNETIRSNDQSSFFVVNFDCQQDELIARAMYNDIIKRILTVSPKGFTKSSAKLNGNDITTIKFNPKETDKSAHQPITEVILDYENLTISIHLTAPTQQ